MIIANSKEIDYNKKAKDMMYNYNSDASHNLLMFAWSRTIEQIVFTERAEARVKALSKRLSEKFSSAIPLIEPAEIRYKLGRLCASLAARLYSVDKTGEKLVVKPEHAEFVYQWIVKVYSDETMAYRKYSMLMQGLYELTENKVAKYDKLFDEVLADTYSSLSFDNEPKDEKMQLIAIHLMKYDSFSRRDLVNVFGYTRDTQASFDKMFHKMCKHDCFFRMKNNLFRKTPAMKNYLEKLMTRISENEMQKEITEELGME